MTSNNHLPNVRTKLRRCLAVFLVLLMSVQVITLPASAKEQQPPQYLEAATMPEEILSADTFYIGTTSADLAEDYTGAYLLKVGRGGDAADAASVVLKMSDVTASYGKDYKVSYKAEGDVIKADDPWGNDSLLDMIEDNRALQTETPLGTEEEQAVAMQQAYAELGEMAAEAAEEADEADTEATASENPLKAAKEAMTGEESDRGTVTSSKEDLLGVLSESANSITSTVQGATLKVDFAPGEKEKDIQIILRDNHKSDGDRLFYITLSEPSEGYTNSMVSEGIFTIKDDEPEELAVVSFEDAKYTAADGKLTVVVKREKALKQTVSVKMKSNSGSARSGIEFSPVDAQVVFPFGVTERKLEIETDGSYLEKDAAFSLTLEPEAGTSIGKIGTASVTVKPTGEAAEKEPEVKTQGLNDTVYAPNGWYVIYAQDGGQNICDYCWNNGHEGWVGHVAYDAGNGNWNHRLRMETYRGSLSTYIYLTLEQSWTNCDYSVQYVYDGVRWSIDSNHRGYQNMVVGLNANGHNKNLWEINTDNIPTSQTAYEANFGQIEAQRIYFDVWNYKDSGKKLRMDVGELTPILRPFKISLKTADSVKFLTGNGSNTRSVTPGAEIVDSGNDRYRIVYRGDKIVIRSTGTEGVNLTGLKIVNSKGQSAVIAADGGYDYSSNGSSTITLTVNNYFISQYHNYVDFLDRGNGRLYGDVKLQPIFSTINTKVTVKPNTITANADTNTFTGTLCINGSAINVGTPSNASNKELTYHCGDTLTLSINSTASDYIPSKVRIEYYDKNLGKNVTDERVLRNGTCSLYLSTTIDRIYLTPLYSENNNIIRVKIHKDDLAKFEHTGILTDANINAAERSGDYYLITVVGTKYKSNGKDVNLAAGQKFQFAVTPKAGYQPVWKETNDANYYQTNLFDYEAKEKRVLNVLYLYAGKESTSKYVSVKAKLYYDNWLLNSKQTGNPVLPAKDGYLTLSGLFAAPDETGVVQTPAFRPVESVTVAGKTVTFGSNPQLNTRLTIAGGNVSQNEDIAINLSGTTAKVSNGTSVVNAIITDQGVMKINVNSAAGPQITGIETTNGTAVSKNVMMNDLPTTIKVGVNLPSGATYGIKKVNFLILDAKTFEEKTVIPGVKSGISGNDYTMTKTFMSDGSEINEYDQGDLIYVQVVTNESRLSDTQTLQDGKTVVTLTAEQKEALEQTPYAPVNTGYTLAIEGRLSDPPVHTLDVAALEGLSGLPLVGNFNANMNFGPVSLKISQLYDDHKNVVGTRISAGMDLFFDATSIGSDNEDLADDGVNYGNFLKKIGNLKGSFRTAANSIMTRRNDAKYNGYKSAAKRTASMGSSKWGLMPCVGFYLDFAMKTVRQKGSTETTQKFICNGGGIMIGLKGNFSLAWYSLLPVVFIPCYFGVSGELTVSANIGASTSVSTKDEVTTADNLGPDYDTFLTTTHDLTTTLHFDLSSAIAATVQVYCGVGICGTLGVRGGVQFDFEFIMEPMLSYYNSYFDPYGFSAGVSAGIWIDLLLFTIPFTFELARFDYKLLKQYAELKDKNETQLKDLLKGTERNTGKKAPAKNDEVDDLEELLRIEEPTAINYELKARDNTPSKWTGKVKSYAPDEVNTMATYKLKNTATLLSDGYDRPDATLIEMGEHGTLMLFLQDDKHRSDSERTALSYSVFKDGVYSDPVIIQTDNTADFQPSVADAGDNVIITWISSDPARERGRLSDENYEANYLKAQEVFCLTVAKADLAAGSAIDQNAIVQLTNDDYYDALPYAVYDSASGDYNVYFIKSAEDTETTAEAVDLANPMNASGNTYSVIAYRVYENGKGWLTTEYAPNEKPDSVSDEAYAAQLAALGGQRLLSSPIKDEDINREDPLIADFHAIGYNGIGVFAYTIDKDMNADTDEDRDLFLQLYDFETRSTYVPIRITDDALADAMPQLVRNGSDEDGTTYLFWMSDNLLKYIDVTSLVKYGVDENGQILDSAIEKFDEEEPDSGMTDDEFDALTPEEQAKASYMFRINQVTTYMKAENTHASYSDYQVAVDNDDNLYVIWVQNTSDGTSDPNQEIFAAAMIESEIQDLNGDGEDDTNKTWSDANQLTDFGMFCDEPALAIADDGQMVMVFNKFDMDTETMTTNDLQLCSSVFEPYCSVEATKIEYSDLTPVEGQDVDVTVTFENTGLTATKNGFTASIYRKAANGSTKLLETYNHVESLIPTQTAQYRFTFKANAYTVGSSIYVSVKENDVQGVNTKDGETFISAPDYRIDANDSYQGMDGAFYTDVILTNTGNVKSKDGDKLELAFNGPYLSAANYGIDDPILGFEMLSLEPGESANFTIQLNVPATAFEKYGFIDVLTRIVDNEKTYASESDSVFMQQPAGLTINDGKNVAMTEGDVLDVALDYATSDFLNDVSPMFVSSDNSVVTIEDGKLVAVGGGETTVTAYAYPYSAATAITVSVKGTSKSTDDSAEANEFRCSLCDWYEKNENHSFFLVRFLVKVLHTVVHFVQKTFNSIKTAVALKNPFKK
ncbi:MAG: hypothetical protein IJU56_01495 [Clostridia bacterium]|nr:hypothetical protein [Clostridia bacterium]